MRKAVTFLLMAITTLTMIFASFGQASAAEPIKIGFIISITGPYGFIGTPQKEVIEAAVADINKKGGLLGRPVEALIEDDKSVPTNAIIAGAKLIKDRNICALVAASSSDSSAALAPMADQEKVPYLITAPIIDPKRKYCFIVGPGDIKGAAHFTEYAAKELKAKRIALLSESAAYGKTGSDTILKEIKKYPGASIVIQEKTEVGDTNLVAQLTKIKAAKPDLLMLYATAGTASVAAKNFKQLGLTIPVLASNAITIPVFLKTAGDIAEEKGLDIFYPAFHCCRENDP